MKYLGCFSISRSQILANPPLRVTSLLHHLPSLVHEDMVCFSRVGAEKRPVPSDARDGKGLWQKKLDFVLKRGWGVEAE